MNGELTIAVIMNGLMMIDQYWLMMVHMVWQCLLLMVDNDQWITMVNNDGS